MTKKTLYRLCVGAILLNENGMVFMGRKKKQEKYNNSLQLPQGGIDEDETAEEALYRELYEETGIRNVKIITSSNGWYSYNFSPDVATAIYDGKYIGQRQKWFVLKFLGNDSEINVNSMADVNKHLVEFNHWQWVHPRNIIKQSSFVKRRIYSLLLSEFESILFK